MDAQANEAGPKSLSRQVQITVACVLHSPNTATIQACQFSRDAASKPYLARVAA